MKKGNPAPPLKIAKLLNAPAGAKADWASLRGKWVVLEFWKPRNATCIAASRHLNDLMQVYSDQPVVRIAITRESPEEVTRVLRRHPIRGWVAIDDDGQTFRAYGVRNVPWAVIVGPQGRLLVSTDPHLITRWVMDEMLTGRDPRRWWSQSKPAAPLAQPKYTDVPPLAGVVVRPANGTIPVSGQTADKLWYANTPLKELIADLWEVPSSRVELRDPIQPDPLTVEIDLKDGRLTAYKKLAREVLPRLLNIRVRVQRRAVAGYVLRARPGASERLKVPASDTDGSLYTSIRNDGTMEFVHVPMDLVTRGLESALGQPVTDETGLKGTLDLTLRWQPGDVRSLQEALRAYGLDLLPTHMPVQFVVVEQAPQPRLSPP